MICQNYQRCVLKMKRIVCYIVIGVLLSLCLVAVLLVKNTGLREVKVNDLLSAVEQNEKMVVYYGQEDCSACTVFSAMLKNKYKEKVFYLDANSITSEEKGILEDYFVFETPTLIVVNNGKLYFYRNLSTKEELEKALTNLDIVEERMNEISKINYDQLKEKYEEGTDFFLYIGRTDCRDCQKFYPVLEKYVNENVGRGVYYLDVKEYKDLATAENADIKDVDFYDDLKDEFDVEWVPSVYHIRNNMILDKYEFLSEEYYNLDSKEQKIEEKEFINEFYDWMEKENR